MRRVHLDRPFTAGLMTDVPAYKVGPRNSVVAQDLIAPEGIARSRRGWDYDGTTADVADNLVGIYRNKFILADATRTVTCDDDGDFFIHNPTSAGTALYAGSVAYLPRCVYRDELIFCAQDGVTPLRRYAGAATVPTITDAIGAYVALGSGYTGVTFNAVPDSGLFLADSLIDLVRFKVVSATTSTVTVEGMTAASAAVTGTISLALTGMTWPGVAIYDAGVTAYSAATLTGHGTKWVDEAAITTDDAIMLDLDNGQYEIAANSDASPANTDLSNSQIAGTVADKATYRIMRRCPFKDAAVHKGSLWGTGVAQYPNRVYVSPPAWNPTLAPGAENYVATTNSVTVSNANDLLLDFIDVPTAFEGDVNVALLSSPNPLLVLKRSAVYGVFGSYPNFSTDKIADGVGCIDLRSAISGPNGQFWAGEDGIYAYVGGQVIDLTQGKINREWRRATSLFDYGVSDYCTIGESNDHLLVSLVTNGGADDYCYVYDLRAQAWMSKWTNHKARYFFSSKVDGEPSELYWVGDDDQGRVMTSSGCFDRNGLIGAKDGDSTSPIFRGWTGEGFDGTQSIDNDSRVLDVAISHNIYDVGADGSTQVLASMTSSGRRESPATRSVILGTIDSDGVDRVDRTRYRPNVAGRLHQLRIGVTTLGTNDGSTTVEIPEITATIRDRRPRP